MRVVTKYHKRLHITFFKVSMLALFIDMLFLPIIKGVNMKEDNTFTVVLNGVECGTVGSVATAEEYLRSARLEVASESSDLLLMEPELTLQGSKEYFGTLDEEESVIDRMEAVLKEEASQALTTAYTLKVNEITVNLATLEDVETLLNDAIDKYDVDDNYTVVVVQDTDRKLNVMTTMVESEAEIALASEQVATEEISRSAGVELYLEQAGQEETETQEELSFDDYEYGIIDMGFNKEIEVVEAYIPASQISTVEEAEALLTEEQEQKQIYTVVKGDTLYGISIALNVTVDDLIAMNDALESEKSTIYVGQELTINVPTPELSVVWQEQGYYEESYEADIIYVNNDSWYTTEKVVRQEPVSGYRKIVAVKTYTNDTVSDTDIVKEEVVVEAVAKIIERGTIVPPTYVYPVKGAKITSYFGYRNVKLKGASTYHKGIDFGVSYGTKVYASCAGTVAKAGWASGYGYVVYINHSDGKQTRYAHLSKVACKVGQYVSQGELIAYSGNSGVSTGPHLHFEILVNGVQKNPLNYLQ